MTAKVDIESNRRAKKYFGKDLAFRGMWAIVKPLYRLSPRLFHSFRRWLLRLFGAQIGRNVVLSPRVRIFAPWQLAVGDWSAIGDDVIIYNLGRIAIGARVTISQNAHLCAGSHDFRDPAMRLLKPPIAIDDDVWICADAFVGPGVHVGTGAVVGARAVVVRDVASWTVIAGNPARQIGQRVLRKA